MISLYSFNLCINCIKTKTKARRAQKGGPLLAFSVCRMGFYRTCTIVWPGPREQEREHSVELWNNMKHAKMIALKGVVHLGKLIGLSHLVILDVEL